MTGMSKRERVLATFHFQETDRAPLYDMILNDAVIERYSGTFPPIGEGGVIAKCKALRNTVDMTRAAYYGPVEPHSWTDEHGFVRLKSDRYINAGIVKRPFGDEAGAIEWLERATELLRLGIRQMDVKKESRQYRDRFRQIQGYIGDDTVVLGEFETGLDEVRANLGLEFFSYILADQPDLIAEYIRLWTDKTLVMLHATAEPQLSPCAMICGDVAMKGGLLHSPVWLGENFFPYVKRISDACHQHGMKVLYHSDGYIMKIIPDLIEAGVDGLNPIETAAGMDLAEVRRACGNRLFLTGGIDTYLLYSGTPETVGAACRKAIAEAAPGYFLGSTTEIDNSARLENVVAMFETAWRKERF